MQPEPVERTFIGRVQFASPPLDRDNADSMAVVGIRILGDTHYFHFEGSGSEWHPGQRVDVILRAVQEVPKVEEEQDAD